MRKYLPFLPLVLAGIVFIWIFAFVIPESVRQDKIHQRARCAAVLVMAKTPADTLKYIQADPTCLEFTTDSQ